MVTADESLILAHFNSVAYMNFKVRVHFFYLVRGFHFRRHNTLMSFLALKCSI